MNERIPSRSVTENDESGSAISSIPVRHVPECYGPYQNLAESRVSPPTWVSDCSMHHAWSEAYLAMK